MIKAGQAYDQRNEFEHRDNVQRDLEQKYDKRSNLTVPIGKKLSFTSAQGQVIEFGYNADGQFTISQDASTPVGIASISYVSTVESTLESSFASLETTLTAEFDTLSATVTTVASGFADLETSFAALETLVESVDPEAAAEAAAASALSASTSATAAGTSATAANTSATNASTSASNAATSASQSSTSETNAAGSAATATTQATNAANSATNAGNSATAASGSASTAATQATAAGNSATSAQNSATSAATEASNAATSAGAASTSAGNASTSASQASTSASNAAGSASSASTSATNAANSSTSAGNSATAASTSASQASTSATNAGNSASSASTQATNAAGSATAAGNSATAASTSASNASTSATNAGNSASSASTSATNAASSQSAAAGSASAASTSASTASTQASNAATSASAASTSATTATTQASNASTSASQASTSAGNAATSASTATTQASNAAGSASTASTQASNASASATAASNSATLSATFASGSQGSINSSATFADNANATGIPTNWADWSNGASSTTRSAGVAPQPYSITITGGAANQNGILQSMFGKMMPGWYVLEADAELISGTFAGAGVFIYSQMTGQSDVSYVVDFDLEPDINGTVAGAGATGKIYRWRKLIQFTHATPNAGFPYIYAAAHWDGMGDVSVANSIKFHRAAIRAASQAEIEARQAKNDLVTTNANVATNTSAIATETSARAAADTTLTARANTLYKASQNLLKNSTFINNGSDWVTSGSPGYFGDGDNRYIAFQATSYQGGYQDVLVVAGRRYSLSAEMYRDTSSMSCRVYVQWLDTTRTTHLGYGGIINHPSTGWVAVKADLEGVNADMIAPTNAVWARIYVDNYQPSSYPSGTSAVRRVCFNGGDYAVPWSEGPVEAALAATNATVATNTSAIATETSARAAADTTLTAQVVSLRNSAPPDRPAVADDFTTNTSNGTPATWAAISVGTVVTAANEGSVRKFTDLQTFTTRSWLPVIAGRTYRMTHRGRVTADGTDNRIIAAFIAHDKDGVASGAIDFHTADAAAVVADGWQTFTRDITATTIISAYASAAYIRPRLSVNRNSASADSGADTEVAILRIEDITEITATNANVTTNASAIATVNGAAAFWETIVSASGGDLSAVRLKAGSTGSYIELISTVLRLANVSNGAVIEVMRAISGEAFFSRPISSDSGARRVTIGPGYGVSGQEVVLWFGPVATAPSSQSRTNGYFALGTDGKVYYGSAELVGGTAPMTATITGDFLDTTRTTAKTPTIDVSPAISGITNGTSPYTYSWSLVEMRDGTAPTLTNATTSSCTLYRAATLINSASYDGTWQCLITDANGKICVKYYKYSDFSAL